MNDVTEIYVHNKSQRHYVVRSFDVVNVTNALDGQRMVMYVGEKRDGSGLGIFVREKLEFYQKFTKLKSN